MWKTAWSLSIAGVLVACGGDDDGDDDGDGDDGGDDETPSLVGTWRTADSDPIDAEYTFRDDGGASFVGRNSQGVVTLQIDGTYEVEETEWTFNGTDQDGVEWFLVEDFWFDETRLAVTALLPDGEVDGLVGRWSGHSRVELDDEVLGDSDVTFDLVADGSAELTERNTGGETTTVAATWEVDGDRIRVTSERDGEEVTQLYAFVEGEALTLTLLFRVDE